MGGAEELDLKQLNFTVRLGKALVSVDYDSTGFHLRYRPNRPGGPCYEWRCDADGCIQEKGMPNPARLCRALKKAEEENAATMQRLKDEFSHG